MPSIQSYNSKRPLYEGHEDWRGYLIKQKVKGRYAKDVEVRARWIFMKIRLAIIEGTYLLLSEMERELANSEARSYSRLSANGDTKAKIKLGKYLISYHHDWVQWEVSHFISKGKHPIHTDHIAEDMRTH